MGFFGLYGSTATLATTLAQGAANTCIGLRRGSQNRWQLVTNGADAPTLADMVASFGIATGLVLTLVIAARPNGSSVWAMNEVPGAVFERGIGESESLL